jgi:CRISPR-associated protein, csm6 family
MAKKILFSPVGGTDPISSRESIRDGSMIHIIRVYKPDKVILYLSKEISEKEKKDKRYTYCIEQLAKLQNRKIEYEIIERPELADVHEYNFYYDEFREILKDIIKSMEKDDKLLLNISSGTPAMKSGLLVLNHLWEDKCESIQVSTPQKSMNNKEKDYDVETIWQLNEDNEENFENRCGEVQCTSLTRLKNEELIKKLIDEYDYDAAYTIATYEDMKNSSKHYIDYLEIAKHRLLLDMDKVDEIKHDLGVLKECYCPVQSMDERKYFEYVLSLNIKIKKRQYADFIRAISPIIKDMFIMIINKELKIDVYKDLCRYKGGKYVWKEEKLKKHENILKILQTNYKNQFKFSDVSPEHFKFLILELVKEQDIKDVVENLRNVEQSVRNITAHEIVSVTEDFIQKKTKCRKKPEGYTSKQIIDDIKKALAYAGINISANDYNSYKYMNEDIKSRIK